MTMLNGEYFDELETMPVTSRERYLNQKLAEAVAHAYRSAPTAREIMDKVGVKPADIRRMRDLERLPVIRKTDVIAWQKRVPPYGGFLAMRPEDIERVFISPGTIYEPIQHSGIQWFAKAFWAAGFRKGDVVINTFTYHLSPAGVLFHEALKDCGATVVVTGTGNTDIQIQAMRDLKVTGFVGTPSFLMTLLKRSEEMGLVLSRDLALRRAWFTGEMLAPSLRKTFEEAYGLRTFQTYAVTEPGGAIAYECREQNGMHMMDDYVVEIVDPETGKQNRHSEVGEVVVTPVHNKAWGLLRFGTGDMSSYTIAPCPCGRTAHRLTGIVGRTSDAVKVRGMFVVARQAETAIASVPAVVRFQIIVSRRDNRDEIILKAELGDTNVDTAKLGEDLNARFQDACRLKLDHIGFVVAGTIDERQPRVVDSRKWE
jgi:phenylacetate-CoA ligase